MIASRSLSWFSYLQNKEKIYEFKIKVKSKLIRALCSSSTIAATTTQWSFLFIVQKLLGILSSKSVNIWFKWILTFSNFYCMFLNPNNFFQFEFQLFQFIRYEKPAKKHSVTKNCWPFTVWINCSSDLKNCSRSLEQVFLTVGQNNFVNKIPFLDILDHSERPKPLFWFRSHIKPDTQNG